MLLDGNSPLSRALVDRDPAILRGQSLVNEQFIKRRVFASPRSSQDYMASPHCVLLRTTIRIRLAQMNVLACIPHLTSSPFRSRQVYLGRFRLNTRVRSMEATIMVPSARPAPKRLGITLETIANVNSITKATQLIKIGAVLRFHMRRHLLAHP